MHAYLPTYLHTCMHTYINTYIHTYTHACMHACMHAYIHTYIHTHTYKCFDMILLNFVGCVFCALPRAILCLALQEATCMRSFLCVGVCTCILASKHPPAHVPSSARIQPGPHINTTHTHTYTHRQTHTHRGTKTIACIYKQTGTHTPTLVSSIRQHTHRHTRAEPSWYSCK